MGAQDKTLANQVGKILAEADVVNRGSNANYLYGPSFCLLYIGPVQAGLWSVALHKRQWGMAKRSTISTTYLLKRRYKLIPQTLESRYFQAL